jgi:hypothetical protein
LSVGYFAQQQLEQLQPDCHGFGICAIAAERFRASRR